MRNVVFFICLLQMMGGSCKSQINRNNANIDTMKSFDTSAYKNWDVDNYYSPSSTDTYLKKGDKRVSISDFDKVIKIEESDIKNPTRYFFIYDKENKTLTQKGQNFYAIPCGKWDYYDSAGTRSKEVNYDELYKFSVDDLINKMQKEYKTDLLDMSKKIQISIGSYKNHKNCYQVSIPNLSTDGEHKIYKIDAETGETLLDTVNIVSDKNKEQ